MTEQDDLQEMTLSILAHIMQTTQDAQEMDAREMRVAIARVNLAMEQVQQDMADNGYVPTEAIKETVEGITAFISSAAYKAYKEKADSVSAFIQQHRADLAQFAGLPPEEVEDLAPELEIELVNLHRPPEDLQSLLAAEAPEIKEAIERAAAARATWRQRMELLEALDKNAPRRIIAKAAELLHYPLDKPNSRIWNMLTEAKPDGQISMKLVTSKKGSKADAIVYYAISFDGMESELKITKQLTTLDKRVYIAAAALFNGGNDVISVTQIYKMMGNRGRPKAEDLKKINDSLTKMGAARVFLDNAEEVRVNKQYARFKYDAALLPFERISAYINGQLTESAIHLFREPPLITFARERKQITSITRQLLESPISKTEANLLLEDYLLERIGHMKNAKGGAPRKMLFATIYERCRITTKKQRQRTPEKIQKYLDHYTACGWIKGYTMERDGVTIHL